MNTDRWLLIEELQNIIYHIALFWRVQEVGMLSQIW